MMRLENLVGMRPQTVDLSAEAILLESARDKRGYFDMKKLDGYVRELSRKAQTVAQEREKKQAMLAALDRLLKRMKNSDLRPHAPTDAVFNLKKNVRPENFIPLERVDHAPPVEQFLTSHWFDFRSMPTANADDMIRFGRELVEQGLVRLPFDSSVFVFSYVNDDGPLSSACLVRQEGSAMVASAVLNYFNQGYPVGIYGPDKAINDPVFFALAVLSSKSVTSVRRSVATGEAAPSTYRGDVYSEVCILGRDGDGMRGGGHASPRLHWRRGHIRHLGDRTTWVRPTLVGASDNGVVLHDYVTTPAT